MVRAFILLTLGGADPPATPGHAPPSPAPCRLLYARTFGNPPRPGGPPRQRLRRKEELLAVARYPGPPQPPPHPTPRGGLGSVGPLGLVTPPLWDPPALSF